jgi:hypothetical protein
MRNFPGVMYLLLLGAGASLANCAGRFNDLCDQADQCANGNDADYDACVTFLETIEEVSEVNGCEDQFDRWFECFETHNECDDNSGDNDDELEPGPECDDEGEDLNDCIN